ncbi:hypothetical protein SS50377_23094 [Spironucleus salmonicida]|uniref:Uncharacterized protein n=1 Tax=Spironucleus salmonicida TaxID=348837 RepID=V6LBF0_9EUKA|nr:hypothetical protein SS50377_23094 [Spironucleus salmonicida]|eukprot:EST41732.1 hypothetical protein SS50377_18818 [Spironucleus salmonicida]
MLRSLQVMDLEVLLKRADLKNEKQAAKIQELQKQNAQLQQALKQQLGNQKYKYLIQSNDPDLISNIEILVENEIDSLNKDLLQITLIKYCTGQKTLQSSCKASSFINAMQKEFAQTKNIKLRQEERGTSALNFCNILESIYQGKCEVIEDKETMDYIMDKYNSDSTIQQQQFGVVARQRILEGYKTARSKALSCEVQLQKETKKVQLITEKLQKGFDQECQELMQENIILRELNSEFEIKVISLQDELQQQEKDSTYDNKQIPSILLELQAFLDNNNCQTLHDIQEFINENLKDATACQKCFTVKQGLKQAFETDDFLQIINDRDQLQQQILNLNTINIEQNEQIQSLFEEKDSDSQIILEYDELKEFLFSLFKINTIDEPNQFNSLQLIKIIQEQFETLMKPFQTTNVTQLYQKIVKCKKELKSSLDFLEHIQNKLEQQDKRYQSLINNIHKSLNSNCEDNLIPLKILQLSKQASESVKNADSYKREIYDLIISQELLITQVNDLSQQCIQEQIIQHEMESQMFQQNHQVSNFISQQTQQLEFSKEKNLYIFEKLLLLSEKLQQLSGKQLLENLSEEQLIDFAIQQVEIFQKQNKAHMNIFMCETIEQLQANIQQLDLKVYSNFLKVIQINQQCKLNIDTIIQEISHLKYSLNTIKESITCKLIIPSYVEKPRTLFVNLLKKVNEEVQLSFQDIIQILEQCDGLGINATYLGLIMRRIFERSYE